jgi:hypothetical protein
MRSARNCAPTGCTVEARGITKTLDALSVPQCEPAAQAGKWLAMALYNCGVADMGRIEAAFVRLPSWRSV